MDTREMPVIELRGSAREKGRIHGEALRAPIQELLSRWRDSFADNYSGLDYYLYRDKFWELAQTRPALERYTPTLLEEVAGMAEAADVDGNELLIFQHANELIWVASHLARLEDDLPERCSTFAAMGRDGSPNIIGQNVDWTEDHDGYQVLFRADGNRDGLKLLISSCAGYVCMNGMNSDGVAVGDNAIPQLRAGPGGLPSWAIYRALLECKNYHDAERFLYEVPHASGLNWVIGDPNQVGMFEVSANKVIPYRPFGTNERLFHSNHPMVNDDYDANFMRAASISATALGNAFPRSTYLRWASLQMRFWDTTKPVTVDQAKAAFSACDDPKYPVCRTVDPNATDRQIAFSLVSCIWELDSENLTFHLASGPAAETPFLSFNFDNV